MADEIQRTIYKLEIDDSGYIRGIDSLSASTQRFAQLQDGANKRLQEARIALKAASDAVAQQQRELDNANKGTNSGVIKIREDALKKAQAEQARLTELVKQTEIEYEKATKLATDFANTTARAGSLTQGGRVPVPPVVQQPVAPIIPPGNLGLGEAVATSAAEFEQLRGAIAAAELALSQMNEESEEFKALAPSVEAGKKALADYDAAAESAGQSTLSLRGQIRQGREELVKMEQQGRANSKEYFELEKRVASLTDAYGDQQQRIKTLASDTKLLDFGKEAITAATAAFSAYTSVSVLVGDQNEELQKKTLQLFAAMQLLQSLEQLSNITRRESKIITLAQSAATGVYETVVGAATGATKAFRVALLSTVAGAVLIGIGLLVARYIKLREETQKAREEQKLFNDLAKDAADSVASEVTKIDIYKQKLNDLSISQKDRVKIAKEYNKVADEQNKIDIKQIDNLDLINQKIDAQVKLILQRAIATAASNKLTAESNKVIEDEIRIAAIAGKTQFTPEKVAGEIESLRKELNETFGEVNKTTDGFINLNNKQEQQYIRLVQIRAKYLGLSFDEIQALLQLTDKRKKDQKSLEDMSKALQQFITIGGLTTGGTGGGDNKQIENIFVQERDKLLATLAELRRSEEDGITKINNQFAAKLEVERNRITQLLKDKKITGDLTKSLEKQPETEAGKLFKLSVEVNDTELKKALADFNKKVLDAREKLNDDLRKLQEQTTEDTLNLIQDEFEKRKALIDFNEQQELADQKEFTDDRLKALDLDRLLIGEETYQRVKAGIIESGEQNSLNILAKFAGQRKDLAADIFKQSLDAIGGGLNIGLIFRDENLANEVRDASNRFLQGKISYEAFQKELTAIQKREEGIRRDSVLSNQRSELAELDRHIATILDKTSQEYKELTQRRNDLRTKIAQGEKEDAVKDAEDTNADENTRKVETLNDYVVAVGQLADSVIQFWQAANEAESAALDRSISLQEKRVEAAQRIAERGNAQYLKAEEDRLKELQVKRENAARRQLAIDAALQASQLLVGITGAISKIATPGIGIAETIGAFAVIVSSLATGYGLVKSLQGNQPRFAKGDPYVKRNGHPAGVDTIPAWLNEGEAVIPTETNRKYHPAIKAIYDEKIPAEHINNFVKNYHSIKAVPAVNYQRIKESAELNVTTDGRMAVAISEQNKLIQENNELQRLTLRAMKNMSVSANIDRDGVAIMVNEYVNQKNIERKV